jgi:hypothetical protein
MRQFVFLKSFGDLVIACRFLRDVEDSDVGMFCGEHLQSLVLALGYKGSISWVKSADHSVPAFYDWNKRGTLHAIKSGFLLKHEIKRCTSYGDELVFDRLTWREAFLGFGLVKSQIISGENNIYLDYRAFTSNCSFEIPRKKNGAVKVGIFPDSRLKTKQLPDELVRNIFLNLVQLGYDPEVVYVGDVIVPSILPSSTIFGFYELIDKVLSFDVVVSSDSLPAHLAEYHNLPVFVFSPVDNLYWLPESSFHTNGYARFDQINRLNEWFCFNV